MTPTHTIINYWMYEALMKFLEANCGQFNPPIERKFVTGLKNSSGTSDGLNRIRNSVLQVAQGKMETDQGPQALQWITSFLDILENEAYQPRTKVREALFFPSEASEQHLIQWINSAQTMDA